MDFVDFSTGIVYNTIMRVVIDTNVMLSGLKSRNGYSFRLLSQIPQQMFRPCVSVPLVLEYEAVLKKHLKFLTDQQIDDVINYICSVSEHTKIHYLWRPVLRDPFDDHILELAINAQAKTIVTFNSRDFGPSSEFGIEIMRPKEFLQSLEE
jgi:putative PIN family toxin of toxin-antitoxin system